MRSFTLTSNRRPKLPPGWNRAKSSALNSRFCSNATASASPSASVAVVLAVGANPIGQASSATDTSSATSEFFAKVEFIRPVMEMTGIPKRFTNGSNCNSSWVSPLLEIATKTSRRANMPRSPWTPSAGCTKNEDVPVLARVAAIFCPICPDLPIPDTTTFPLQRTSVSTALTNRSSSRPISAWIARASISSTRCASARMSLALVLRDFRSDCAMPIVFPHFVEIFDPWLNGVWFVSWLRGVEEVNFVVVPHPRSSPPVPITPSTDATAPYWVHRTALHRDSDGLP